MQLTKKTSILFLVLVNIPLILLSLIYDHVFDMGLIGQCIFLNTFGFYCPGCGGSRSLNALLNFDLISSFIYYPPIPIAALIILYFDIRTIHGLYTENYYKISTALTVFIPAVIILQFIIKNLLLLFGIDILGNILG